MLLPTTYTSALLLLIVSMLCWGSWANAQKMAGKWRFELFYYDYSVGLLLCAVVAAFTLGEMIPKELTFSDNLLIASKRQITWSIASGVVFNLANMLLVAAISVSGLAVAFPISIGFALVISVVWNYAYNPQGSPLLVFSGVALVLVAIVVDAFAFAGYVDEKQMSAQALNPDPRSKKPAPKIRGAAAGIVLSLISGILLAIFYPILDLGRQGDGGVAPYGLAVLFAAGVLVSTLFYTPFFLNFPVSGAPIEAREYFNGTGKQHLLGLLGGIVWMVGGISSLVGMAAPGTQQVGSAVTYALGQGATLVSALWGLLVWREFAGSSVRVKTLLVVMLVLFAAGIGMISIAPLHGT